MRSKKILRELEEDLKARGKTQATINSFLNIAERFLKTVKDSKFTQKDVTYYISTLRDSNYKDNYIRYQYYVISRIFKVLGKDFRGEVPKINNGDVSQPVFTLDQVEKLITTAKNECDVQQRALLCISTVYGTRRAELASIRPEDVKKNTVLIKTRKGGMIREHTIPDSVKKYIQAYDWKEEMSISRMSALFTYILYLCKFNLDKGLGWHVIRRSLVSELMRKNIDHFAIQSFLRWKVSGMSMLYRYTHIPMQDVEKVIFENHPFLNLW